MNILNIIYPPKPYRVPQMWGLENVKNLTLKGKDCCRFITSNTKMLKDDYVTVDLGLLITLCKVTRVITVPRTNYLMCEAKSVPSRHCSCCNGLYEVKDVSDICPKCKVK